MTLIALPTAETKVPTSPISFAQHVEGDEHLVRGQVDQHEIKRMVLQLFVYGGYFEFKAIHELVEAIKRDRQAGHFRPELHDALSEALDRVASRVTAQGFGTWDVDPDVAKVLELALSDASEEPAACPDCHLVYIGPDQTYCGRCDDAHTHPRSA